MEQQPEEIDAAIPSGISGLDDILRGGYPQHCLSMISGVPGTGKTTLAMQFLLDGVRRGERCLYITLSETRAEMEKVACSHGWDLRGISIMELVPSERNLSTEAQLTVFNPSELELGETTQAIPPLPLSLRSSRPRAANALHSSSLTRISARSDPGRASWAWPSRTRCSVN